MVPSWRFLGEIYLAARNRKAEVSVDSELSRFNWLIPLLLDGLGPSRLPSDRADQETW